MAETEESAPQWFLRFQETNDRRLSRLEAMVADLLCRSRKGKKENPEDQICNDEELAEIEAESREGLVHKAILEKESIPQVQVPIANSEIARSIEPGKVDLRLEKEEYVVLNENLEEEWDQKNDNKEIEVDGDIERGQEAMSNTKICSAHQLFDQMPGRSSRANRVWKPGGLLYVRDHSGGSILMITQQFHGLQLQRIIYMDMKFQKVLIDDVLSVMVCWRMDETSSDLLLLNGKENEGCLNGSQALVLMKGITESSSRIEELLKEEPDFVKVNEVKMEKQKLRNVGDGVKQDKNRFSGEVGAKIFMALEELHPLLGDESFQIKHKWRFKLLPLILGCELHSNRLVFVTNYVQQFDTTVFFSTNLEVKVSSKEGDLI